MKLLLDENLPHRLRLHLTGHDVFTVAYMNWAGLENGDLLAAAAGDGFDAVLTMDQGIYHEQNAANLPCAVVILQSHSNSLSAILPLVKPLLAALNTLNTKSVIRIAISKSD